LAVFLRAAAGADRVGGFRGAGAETLVLEELRLVRSHGLVEARVGAGYVAAGGGEEHFFFFFFNARFFADELDPLFCVAFSRRFEVVVAGGGEESEDVATLLFGVFEEGYGGEVGEVDFMPQFVFVCVFVY
jgi:hypothetical protein